MSCKKNSKLIGIREVVLLLFLTHNKKGKLNIIVYKKYTVNLPKSFYHNGQRTMELLDRIKNFKYGIPTMTIDIGGRIWLCERLFIKLSEKNKKYIS